MKSFWHNKLSLLQCPYSFTLCLTEDQFKHALKGTSIPEKEWGSFMENKRANAETHFFHGYEKIIVCMKISEGIDNIIIAAMLVHEAVHIWRQTCLNIGEDSPASEEEAYGIQGISQALMDLYVCRINNSSKWMKELIK